MSGEVAIRNSRSSHIAWALLLVNVIALPLLLVVTWGTMPSEGYWTAILTILTAYPALVIAGFTLLYSRSPARVQLGLDVFRRSWRFGVFVIGTLVLAVVLLLGFRGLVSPSTDMQVSIFAQNLKSIDNWSAPLSISLLFIGIEVTGVLAWEFIRLQTPLHLARQARDVVIRNPQPTRSIRKRLLDVTENEARHDDDDFGAFINGLIEIAIADSEAKRLDDAKHILSEIIHFYTMSSSNRDIGVACLDGLLKFIRQAADPDLLNMLKPLLDDGQIVASLSQSDHPSNRQVVIQIEIAIEMTNRLRGAKDVKDFKLLDQLWDFWTTKDLPVDVDETFAQQLVPAFPSMVSKLDDLLSRSLDHETTARDLQIISAFLMQPSLQGGSAVQLNTQIPGSTLAKVMMRLMVGPASPGRSQATCPVAASVAEISRNKSGGARRDFKVDFIRRCEVTPIESGGVRWGAEVLVRSVLLRCRDEPELRGRQKQFSAVAESLHALSSLERLSVAQGLSDAFQGTTELPVIRLAREQLFGAFREADATLASVPLVVAASAIASRLAWELSQQTADLMPLTTWEPATDEFIVNLKGVPVGFLQSGLASTVESATLSTPPMEESRDSGETFEWLIRQLTSMVSRLETIQGESSQRKPAMYYTLLALGVALSCDMHAVHLDSQALTVARRFALLMLENSGNLDVSDAVMPYLRSTIRSYFIENEPTWDPEALAESSDASSVLVLRRLSREVFLDQQEFTEPWLRLVAEALRKTIPQRRLVRSLDILTAEGLPSQWEAQFAEYVRLPTYEDLSAAAVAAYVRGAHSVVAKIIAAAANQPGNQGWQRAFIAHLKDAGSEVESGVTVAEILLCAPASAAEFVPHVGPALQAQLLAAMVAEDSGEDATSLAGELSDRLNEKWKREQFLTGLEKARRVEGRASVDLEILSIDPKLAAYVLRDSRYSVVCKYIARAWSGHKSNLADHLLGGMMDRGGGEGWQFALLSNLSEALAEEAPQIPLIPALAGHPDAAVHLASAMRMSDLAIMSMELASRREFQAAKQVLELAHERAGQPDTRSDFVAQVERACRVHEPSVDVVEVLVCSPSWTTYYTQDFSYEDIARVLATAARFDQGETAQQLLRSVMAKGGGEGWQIALTSAISQGARQHNLHRQLLSNLAGDPSLVVELAPNLQYSDIAIMAAIALESQQIQLIKSLLEIVRDRGGGPGWQRAFIGELSRATQQSTEAVDVVRILACDPQVAAEIAGSLYFPELAELIVSANTASLPELVKSLHKAISDLEGGEGWRTAFVSTVSRVCSKRVPQLAVTEVIKADAALREMALGHGTFEMLSEWLVDALIACDDSFASVVLDGVRRRKGGEGKETAFVASVYRECLNRTPQVSMVDLISTDHNLGKMAIDSGTYEMLADWLVRIVKSEDSSQSQRLRAEILNRVDREGRQISFLHQINTVCKELDPPIESLDILRSDTEIFDMGVRNGSPKMIAKWFTRAACDGQYELALRLLEGDGTRHVDEAWHAALAQEVVEEAEEQQVLAEVQEILMSIPNFNDSWARVLQSK